ncbi:hypothetical protein CU097_014571 [Rhizopus azygosporus]|uniref:Uncharacterized protein n=1 Tax=Rhizopus azygosporus TaxID=86630 RepID=A0A367KGU8_RHIAZ|nr:hypothetical protein CU097_014571 [Rhizopus azygosporus]
MLVQVMLPWELTSELTISQLQLKTLTLPNIATTWRPRSDMVNCSLETSTSRFKKGWIVTLINAYELASNTKLNLDKTIAVSLSGQSQPLWRDCLQHRGITHWHDSNSHMAAIYLGFPLTSSSTQLSTFLDELLSSTRLTAHRLASRRLSIQERGLIAITLILNRIWHCLCVLVVPACFLAKIRSIIGHFINFKSFPKVSFDTCQRYRKEGGLAVLDPDTQLHALQLCWLRSLVQPDTESNYKYSFTLQVLQHCLYSFFGSPSPILPLAFAELRSPDVKPMDLLTVELPGAMDFQHITLKLFQTSQLLPIDALPANYLCGPDTAWRTF